MAITLSKKQIFVKEHGVIFIHLLEI